MILSQIRYGKIFDVVCLLKKIFLDNLNGTIYYV